MNPLIQHISKIVNLDDKEIELILSYLSEQSYKKGDSILQNGDVSNTMHFIVKGAVKKFYIDNSGKEHIMMLGIENWWAGDMSSFITQSPAAFNVKCTEPTEVLKLSKYNHSKLLEEVPKMQKFFRILTENAYVATQARIIQNFTMTAKDRYLHFADKYPEHMLRFPQYMIASYLGITKEFLSKIRSQPK